MSCYKDDILEIFRLGLPWEKLSGKKLLVTGSTGLIGGCLVETLMSNPHLDYHVYASGRNYERARKRFEEFWNSEYFHFFEHDVTSPLKSEIVFNYIIDAASNASPNFFLDNPVEVIKANVYGVSNLMEYGLSHKMERFLYVSSGEVYGEGDGRVFTENYSGYIDCLSSRSCYPSSKRTAETLCVSYAVEYGSNVVIARPCHIYGPYFSESDNRVYAQFIRNVLKGEDIILKSAGTQFRSWCYVVDCVSALLYILLKGEQGHAYNIADANSNITIKALAELIADIAGRSVHIEKAEVQSAISPISRAVFDTCKLQNLGWHIAGSMRNKLGKTIQECR